MANKEIIIIIFVCVCAICVIAGKIIKYFF